MSDGAETRKVAVDRAELLRRVERAARRISRTMPEDLMVRETSRLKEDLELESIDEVELVLAIEEEFGIQVPDEDAQRAKTVGDILDYLERML